MTKWTEHEFQDTYNRQGNWRTGVLVVNLASTKRVFFWYYCHLDETLLRGDKYGPLNYCCMQCAMAPRYLPCIPSHDPPFPTNSKDPKTNGHDGSCRHPAPACVPPASVPPPV